MEKYLNLKLALVMFFVLISGLSILSSFRSESFPAAISPANKSVPKIDTIAQVFIVRTADDVYVVGGYRKDVFYDECDVYEVIAKSYVHTCISAKTDSTFHPKVRRL